MHTYTGGCDLHDLCGGWRPAFVESQVSSVAHRREYSGHGGRVLHPHRARYVHMYVCIQDVCIYVCGYVYLGVKQLVLVGDHCQLGPVVMCKKVRSTYPSDGEESC